MLELVSPVALDPDQQQAVDHIEGPCLVLAGPGSGKTRVIVERFLAQIRRGVPAEQQLVLTYTRKAADEMRTRAEDSHGAFGGELPLTNYHSFALKVVRDWGWLLGISPAVRIADPAERWMHVEAVLEEVRPPTLWNPLRPHDLMDPLLAVIATAKQELVTPDAYTAWAASRLETCADPAERVLLQRHAEVADVYTRIEERYRRLGVFDHDDSILYAQRLLDKHPAARSAVAGRIRYVMVDEYQDTNFAQARLVETLVAAHHNILVVADDDQSIYKFRGASRANLDRFTRTYPEHKAITLRHNYRSTTPIVVASRAVIAGASLATRIEKQLIAERGDGRQVEIWTAEDEHSECAAVAAECRRLIDDGARPASIAWLFRKHVDMQAAMYALREHAVPYQVSGGRGFFQEREIKDVFALLSAAADPDDSQALLRCLHLPAWQLGGAARAALARAAREHEMPLGSLVREGPVDDVTDEDLARARQCIDDIVALHELTQREDVRDVFYAALERSEFLGILAEQAAPARLQMGANLNKFGELLDDFADWCNDRRVETALRWLHILRDSREAGEVASIEPIEDGIVLLTAHGAKGLEWDVVFLARCTRDRWSGRGQSAYELQLPDELVPEPAPVGDAAIDEERRLFYVATTRARDRLVYASALRYPRSYSDQESSPFLAGVTSCDPPAKVITLPRTSTVSVRPARPAGALLNPVTSMSVSDLRDFKACPRKYEYDRRWKLPIRQSVRSWYGTLMHDVLRTAALQRSTGADVDEETISALWHQAWDSSRGPKGAHSKLRADGEQQLRRYVASDAWRDAHIDAAEENFAIPLSGDLKVTGRFDRVGSDREGVPMVVDYKTGPPRDEAALRRDLQVRGYAVALSQRATSERVAVELHYLQIPEVVRLDLDRKFLTTAFGNLAATAGELIAAAKAGDFPARPSRFLCPRCEFRTVCDEGRAAYPG